MSTDLQRLAQKENWALFVIRGMRSNLVHLRSVVHPVLINDLNVALKDAESIIVINQDKRKHLKQLEKDRNSE